MPTEPPFRWTLNVVLLGSVLLLAMFARPVMSWEFAVTTSGQIIFYDHMWKPVTTAAHQHNDPSAIAYDETTDTLYFNDRTNHSGTIYALRLSATSHQNHRISRVATSAQRALVQGIAFDPLQRQLYWADASNARLLSLQLNRTTAGADEPLPDSDARPQVFLPMPGTDKPQGIAIDVCRRNVYWTTYAHGVKPSIRRASLDGARNEVIVSDGLDMPLGIVVDQYSRRIYWVDDQQGRYYSVESAALDGSARRTLVNDMNNAPQNLAVDQESVYWTDDTYRAVWRVAKNATQGAAEKVVQFKDAGPNGVIVREQLLARQAQNAECALVVDAIKSHMELVDAPAPATQADQEAHPAATATAAANRDAEQQTAAHNFCLNGGQLNVATNSCICTAEYKGAACELPVCHNYCVQGVCSVSAHGYPQCRCALGYVGDRCERDVCQSFCLNGGRCAVNEEKDAPSAGEAMCHCVGAFRGRRCEHMDEEEVCRRWCEFDEELDGFRMRDLCGSCEVRNATATDTDTVVGSVVKVFDPAALNNHSTAAGAAAQTCAPSAGEGINKTALIVTVGVVASLGLVYLIVCVLQRFYKPLRPRVKKTFVVRNKNNRTPMTCRPNGGAVTEQCEITIENCCNMNICDTPCFDPKTIQQELNKEPTRKEDKYKLLSNMDGDLY